MSMEEALNKITNITTQATSNNGFIAQISERLREISGQIGGIAEEKRRLEAEITRLTAELGGLNGRLEEEGTRKSNNRSKNTGY